MSSFAFVPRSVKRRKIDSTESLFGPAKTQSQVTVSSQAPATPTSDGAQVASESSLPRDGGSKGKHKKPEEVLEDDDTQKLPTKQASSKSSSSRAADLEDLAGLVCLALSDYALWANPDLRQRIDLDSESPERCHDSVKNCDDDGLGCMSVPFSSLLRNSDRYSNTDISLAYLFQHSPAFFLVSGLPSFVDQPETTYVKALRAHAGDYIDVRLIVNPEVYISSRPTAHWSKATTGYEVRRKNLPKPNHSGRSGHGKAYWDNSTIYVVRTFLSTSLSQFNFFLGKHSNSIPQRSRNSQIYHIAPRRF